jgi:hypothetical protein
MTEVRKEHGPELDKDPDREQPKIQEAVAEKKKKKDPEPRRRRRWDQDHTRLFWLVTAVFVVVVALLYTNRTSSSALKKSYNTTIPTVDDELRLFCLRRDQDSDRCPAEDKACIRLEKMPGGEKEDEFVARCRDMMKCLMQCEDNRPQVCPSYKCHSRADLTEQACRLLCRRE